MKQNTMKQKYIFHFRTPDDMGEEVKKIAEETQTSTSMICRDAMSFYLSTGAWRMLDERAEVF
tara:strand:- start:737 stop:925 length:189 start_codon:yes stop_codon:yes gene_type:complete